VVLKAVNIEPKQKRDACVIWLHGLGADGYDFVHAVPSLGLSEPHSIEFIFPHAPPLPVTINGGFVMPAWYDILGPDLQAQQDAKGLKKSEEALKALLLRLMAEGVSSKRIILIGFSQGGALALYTALRFDHPLGGVAALSAYLPIHTELAKERHHANDQIPIFMGHGLVDPVVPYWVGKQSCSFLQTLGYAPLWHDYPIPHTVCLPELMTLGNWINQVYGSKL